LSFENDMLLTNMANWPVLPWHLILSAELVHHYKPDPETYLMVPHLLNLPPEEVMMVAAHVGDLRAAQAHDLQAAYVPVRWNGVLATNPSRQTRPSTLSPTTLSSWQKAGGVKPVSTSALC
jgi:beta-phosphoglucomutase-like phosphatase (HAD superfamily)